MCASENHHVLLLVSNMSINGNSSLLSISTGQWHFSRKSSFNTASLIASFLIKTWGLMHRTRTLSPFQQLVATLLPSCSHIAKPDIFDWWFGTCFIFKSDNIRLDYSTDILDWISFFHTLGIFIRNPWPDGLMFCWGMPQHVSTIPQISGISPPKNDTPRRVSTSKRWG